MNLLAHQSQQRKAKMKMKKKKKLPHKRILRLSRRRNEVVVGQGNMNVIRPQARPLSVLL